MDYKPKGIIPALVTPLDAKENINEQGLRKLINHVIEGGVHGLFVIGTTGEFYGLTPEEKKLVIEITNYRTKHVKFLLGFSRYTGCYFNILHHVW